MSKQDDAKSKASRSPGSRAPLTTREKSDRPTFAHDASDAGPAPDLTGATVGEYEVLELIGTGGGGQVYRARHRRMGRSVAVKFIARLSSSSSLQSLRFQREVKAAAQLMHPNIVTAFDAGEYEGMLYLVMEYVEGRSLFQIVLKQGPMSLRQATELLLQAAHGLAYAHSKGIVHRDVKPSNLMLDDAGHVKILDMGLARIADEAAESGPDALLADLTAHGTVVGTAGFISPEQISNARGVDHRTDIYSLGCTYYFLLTGQTPYSGSLMETLVAHVCDPVPSLHAARDDLPIALDEVMRRLMAKELADRFASVEEVITALQPFAEGAKTGVAVKGAPVAVPNESSGSLAAQKSIGIDIGTNTAHVSWISGDGYPQGVKSDSGELPTPSVVRFQRGSFTVGKPALETIRVDAADIAEQFVCRLGHDDYSATLDGKRLPVEVLTAALVRQLSSNVQHQVGYFDHPVYTVPGLFGDAQRRAYADAMYIAYLEPLRTINASTAVVLNFSFLHGWLNPQRTAGSPKTLLVFRFGGGSFDATVFRVENRVVTALAIVGDPRVSGSAWDERIVQCVADQLKKQHAIDVMDDPARLLLLRRHCESGKMALTDKDQFPFRVQVKNRSMEGVLRRGFVNRLGGDLLNSAERLTNAALRVAGLNWRELDHVLLAGGTTRMPIVRQSVETWCGNRDVVTVTDDAAAAAGAALCAQMHIDGPGAGFEFQSHEVTSHYFGIRGVDRQSGEKKTSVIVPCNARLPAAGRGTIRTSKPDQTSMTLTVVEGIDDECRASRPVGVCRLENLPPGQPAGAPVEVEFLVAENGCVSVSFESIATGRRSSPELQRAGGLSVSERQRWRDWLYTGSVAGEFS